MRCNLFVFMRRRDFLFMWEVEGARAPASPLCGEVPLRFAKGDHCGFAAAVGARARGRIRQRKTSEGVFADLPALSTEL